ncbi:MAG: YciI family protein [Myxococcota bacterium]
MLLIEDRRSETQRASVSPEEMGKFARELAERGILRGAAGPLRPDSEAARVRLRDGRAVVTDGPFPEASEVLGGYFVVDVADRAAAVEIAKRCPYARTGLVEVRAMKYWRRSEGNGGAEFVLLYIMDPSVTGPDEPRIAKMMTATDELQRAGTHLGGARLEPEIPGTRVELRGERAIVLDGPFAESKEVFGGFALIQAASRAEAIEIALRIPHSGWGTTEVREVGRRGAP